ncbi:MAG: type IV pilus modification PilV family protein, partial [Arenimonas sp.]
MKTPNKFAAQNGFSLLEVLLAAAILSFGLLALASLQLSLFRSSSDTKAQSVALGLAKEQIETIKTYT